jgi:cytochrome c biogenesis protein CcdA/thiol-disulfide isomerase/thioredoxin
MTLFVLAYLAGVLTIATPCILPILPFVLARADVPFRRGGLPMLLGLALAFAGISSLAAVAGGWAVAANEYGRILALAVMTLFGATMLLPALATRVMAPLVSLGGGLARRVEGRGGAGASVVLGLATGLIWAPCAGPILGLILTGAALRGPSAETSLLLLTYGLGAASALAIGVLFGRRLVIAYRQTAHWGEGARRVLGAAVLAGVAAIGLGADTGILTRLSAASTDAIERGLISTLSTAQAADSKTASEAELPLSAPLLAVLGAAQWLNTKPLAPEDLRGKVVLVNFWTYSCINCLRSLPHVRAWAERYKDDGLVVIGVHTPEFAFEKNADNVRKAAMSLGVSYPVAIDNDFGIWKRFNNQAWPALYFIGADGRVRHHVFGEGSYAQSEKLIQRLLAEANTAPVAGDMASVTATGAQAEADLRNLRSPETYIGYRQASGFSSPGGVRADASVNYRDAAALGTNQWSLDGMWTIGGEFATLDSASGSVSMRFHARDLHFVLGPAMDGRPVRFRVTIDGMAPGADHGTDTDAEGWGELREDRLYQLVRQSSAVRERVFKIEFTAPGVRAYAFTFG